MEIDKRVTPDLEKCLKCHDKGIRVKLKSLTSNSAQCPECKTVYLLGI